MQYQNVCLESFGYTLPEIVWSSDDLESRLAPLYERLRLPQGRLELITGISERRFWPEDTLPSGPSVKSGEKAIEVAAEQAELAPGSYDVRRLPRPKTMLEQFNEALAVRSQQVWLNLTSSPIEQLLVQETENLRQIIEMNGQVQALMPARITIE